VVDTRGERRLIHEANEELAGLLASVSDTTGLLRFEHFEGAETRDGEAIYVAVRSCDNENFGITIQVLTTASTLEEEEE
jgi:hypothetical protein